jgi:hypothetical protein
MDKIIYGKAKSPNKKFSNSGVLTKPLSKPKLSAKSPSKPYGIKKK